MWSIFRRNNTQTTTPPTVPANSAFLARQRRKRSYREGGESRDSLEEDPYRLIHPPEAAAPPWAFPRAARIGSDVEEHPLAHHAPPSPLYQQQPFFARQLPHRQQPHVMVVQRGALQALPLVVAATGRHNIVPEGTAGGPKTTAMLQTPQRLDQLAQTSYQVSPVTPSYSSATLVARTAPRIPLVANRTVKEILPTVVPRSITVHAASKRITPNVLRAGSGAASVTPTFLIPFGHPSRPFTVDRPLNVSQRPLFSPVTHSHDEPHAKFQQPSSNGSRPDWSSGSPAIAALLMMLRPPYPSENLDRFSVVHEEQRRKEEYLDCSTTTTLPNTATAVATAVATAAATAAVTADKRSATPQKPRTFKLSTPWHTMAQQEAPMRRKFSERTPVTIHKANVLSTDGRYDSDISVSLLQSPFALRSDYHQPQPPPSKEAERLARSTSVPRMVAGVPLSSDLNQSAVATTAANSQLFLNQQQRKQASVESFIMSSKSALSSSELSRHARSNSRPQSSGSPALPRLSPRSEVRLCSPLLRQRTASKLQVLTMSDSAAVSAPQNFIAAVPGAAPIQTKEFLFKLNSQQEKSPEARKSLTSRGSNNRRIVNRARRGAAGQPLCRPRRSRQPSRQVSRPWTSRVVDVMPSETLPSAKKDKVIIEFLKVAKEVHGVSIHPPPNGRRSKHRRCSAVDSKQLDTTTPSSRHALREQQQDGRQRRAVDSSPAAIQGKKPKRTKKKQSDAVKAAALEASIAKVLSKVPPLSDVSPAVCPATELVNIRDRQMRRVASFGWDFAPAELRALSSTFSRSTLVQTCDVAATGLLDLEGKQIVCQAQLVSHMAGSLRERDVFAYYARCGDFTLRLNRFADTRRIQNVVRRLLEGLLLNEELLRAAFSLPLPCCLVPGCPLAILLEKRAAMVAEGLAEKQKRILLPSNVMDRRVALASVFLALWNAADASVRGSDEVCDDLSLSEEGLSFVLHALNLWPSCLCSADQMEITRALCCPGMMNPGETCASIISGTLFVAAMSALPYNLPEFFSPTAKATRRKPLTKAEVLAVALALATVVLTPSAGGALWQARATIAVAEAQAQQGARDAAMMQLAALRAAGMGEVCVRPQHFPYQDYLISNIVSVEELQAAFILWLADGGFDQSKELQAIGKEALCSIRTVARGLSFMVDAALQGIPQTADTNFIFAPLRLKMRPPTPEEICWNFDRADAALQEPPSAAVPRSVRLVQVAPDLVKAPAADSSSATTVGSSGEQVDIKQTVFPLQQVALTVNWCSSDGGDESSFLVGCGKRQETPASRGLVDLWNTLAADTDPAVASAVAADAGLVPPVDCASLQAAALTLRQLATGASSLRRYLQ